MRIAFAPLTLLGLESAALAGILFPMPGRKIYAHIDMLGNGEEPIPLTDVKVHELVMEGRIGQLAGFGCSVINAVEYDRPISYEQ